MGVAPEAVYERIERVGMALPRVRERGALTRSEKTALAAYQSWRWTRTVALERTGFTAEEVREAARRDPRIRILAGRDRLPASVRLLTNAEAGTLRVYGDGGWMDVSPENARRMVERGVVEAGTLRLRPGMTGQDVADVINDNYI